MRALPLLRFLLRFHQFGSHVLTARSKKIRDGILGGSGMVGGMVGAGGTGMVGTGGTGMLGMLGGTGMLGGPGTGGLRKREGDAGAEAGGMVRAGVLAGSKPGDLAMIRGEADFKLSADVQNKVNAVFAGCALARQSAEAPAMLKTKCMIGQ